MALRFHIAICVVTPLELPTLLAVYFAVGLTANSIIPYSRNKKNPEKGLQNECRLQNRQIERRTKTQPDQNKKRNDVKL